MSSFSSLTRAALAVAVVFAGTALAQAPANDLCAGAEVIAPGTFPVTSATARRFDLAAGTVETAMSCTTSVKNSVWYSFTPAVSGVYRMDTCGPVTNFDTVIAAYSGSCGALTPVGTSTTGCNDQGGCAFANASAIALPLTAGTTYFVQVAVWSSVTLDNTLVTTLTISPVSPPANDRCDGTVPSLTLNTPAPVVINAATQDDSQLGGILDGGAGLTCFTGVGHSTTASANASPGRDVVFGFTPPATGAYSVRLGYPSVSVNSVLYLTDSCVAASSPPQIYSPPQCIAASNRGGSSATAAEELVCVSLNSGTPYFIWADEAAASTLGANYELEVTTCTPEVEPNDAPATSSALACPVTGRTNVNQDFDFYSLGTNPAGSRVFALVEAAAAGAAGSNSGDFDLRVTTATDVLEYDDNNADTPFGGSSAHIAGTPLPTAATFLRVNSVSTTTVREPYRVYSVVQTGTPTVESEPNDSPATANGGTSNYFSGDVTATTDIDMFAFEAQAGSLVFLSLDSQPSRSGSTASGNHTLQLLDSAGTALVAVNDSGTTVNNTIPTASLTATTPALPSEGLVYRIRTSGTYVARVGRTSTTGTGPYVLSISTACGVGGGIGAPSLSSLNPATGTVSGGTLVTLSGANFSGLAGVRIGGALATITNRSATSLTVLTPAGTEGAVDVSVINPGGQAATLTGGYLYFAPVAPPTITSVTPATGPTAGGTVITVIGTLFKTGAEVSLTVGGTPVQATAVTLLNSTQLTATTPAHAAGLAALTVRNPVDALEGTRADAFTYLAPPSVASVTPATGVTSGGQTVTLSGTAFRTGAVVRFGANAGTAVVVDPSGTSLTVVTPSALVAGPVAVLVLNADTQQGVLANGFTYTFPAPTITSVTPALGAVAGNTLITLTGTGFQLSPTVTVGGVPATSVTRNSLTQVTARTPAGSAGPADVTLTNSDTQSGTLTAGFTYQAAPSISSVSPSTGLTTGGLTITITGQALRTGAAVRFGTVSGTNVVVAADQLSLTVTTPAVTLAGAVDVTVTNTDTQQGVSSGAFTYTYPAPTLLAVAPSSGFASGGTSITISGTGFQLNPTVRVGGTPATSVVRLSLTQITAVTPAGTAGLADLGVTNSDSQSVSLTGAFRYVPSPTIASVSPANGPSQGGTRITLTGAGFLQGATLRVGGVPAFAVTVDSPTTATAVTNSNVVGPADVVLTNPDTQVTTLGAGFTYDGAPSLLALSPGSGSTAGGTVVTLTGTGFLTGASVLFGATPATNVTVVSPSQLTAQSPAAAVSVVSVTVRNVDGQSASLQRAYRFVAPPTVSTAAPDTGDAAGGTVVRVTGAGFNASTKVSFGGTPAMQVSLVSATELDAVTPGHLPGAVAVEVTTDGAIAALTNGFTFTRGAPTLVAVAPVSGPIAGGTLLTLSGTGFAPGATITVGGGTATDVVIVSSVLARAVVPAHAAGAVSVVLTNDDMQTATLANAFTYVAPPTNNTGTVTDGGSGSIGDEPMGGGGGTGGVSCGCSSFDASTLSMAGFGLLMVLSRRRRRS